MSNEQDHEDRMGQRLDETRAAIEALRHRLAEDHVVFQMNPQMVFTIVLPKLCDVLTQLHDTVVVLDHRLNQLENRQ